MSRSQHQNQRSRMFKRCFVEQPYVAMSLYCIDFQNAGFNICLNLQGQAHEVKITGAWSR